MTRPRKTYKNLERETVLLYLAKLDEHRQSLKYLSIKFSMNEVFCTDMNSDSGLRFISYDDRYVALFMTISILLASELHRYI